MGGIAGFFRVDNVSNSLLTAMAESMIHTKQDRVDTWSDDYVAISRVHHGVINSHKQPLFNAEASLLIFMEGEVFDYESQKKLLISKGYSFRFKDNDAEYCLHLYEEFGDEAFAQLNGSFLIVLYDLKAHRLLIVNDRFSSHALFYNQIGEILLFCTQVYPLFKYERLSRTINMRAVFEFLAFQKVLGTSTYYEAINVLPPSSILFFNDSGMAILPYWKIAYEEEGQAESYYVDELERVLLKAVGSRTRDVHRLGILLSGGLDSRTLLEASGRKMVAFTVGDSDCAESVVAKEIAKAKGCKHFMLEPEEDYFVKLLDKAVEIGDGMYCFVHAWGIGFYDQIYKECDLLFTAVLFDTFFKGHSIPAKRLSMFGKSLYLPFFGEAPKTDDEITSLLLQRSLYKPVEQALAGPYSAGLKKVLKESIHGCLFSDRENGSSKYGRYFDRFVFPSSFNYRYNLCIISLRHYWNERIVAFDNDLFDLYLRTPLSLRLNGRIFRKVLKRILGEDTAHIPNANTGYNPFTPPLLEWMMTGVLRPVIKEVKGKFSIGERNIVGWSSYPELIRKNYSLKTILRQTIEDPSCIEPEYFNTDRIKQLYQEHLSGTKDHSDMLLLLLTFGRWYKSYGPNV